MEWISVKDRLPDTDKMVLCITENEPIVRYVIASYEPDHNCFVDYDDCGYAISHWIQIPSFVE